MNETMQNLIYNSQTLNNTIDYCQLNQIELMNNVQKFPKVAFWLSLIIGLLLIIDFIILPRLEKYQWVEKIHGISSKVATSITPFLIFILGITTYKISSDTLLNVINPIIKYTAIIIMIFLIWENRQLIKETYKKIKEKDEK